MLTIVAACVTAVLAGPWLRGLIYAHSVPYGQPLRSRCPVCDTVAVPHAWRGIATMAPLTGRCPRCRTPIGPTPGSVEVIAVGVLATLTVAAPAGWVLAAWSWTALLGIALAAIDLRVFRLPDPLTAAAGLGALALLTTAATTTGPYPALIRALACAIVLGLAYLFATRSGMGRGDMRLAAVIGLNLGCVNIGAVIVATVAAVLLAAGYGATMITAHRLQHGDRLPFGPFMLAGALIATVIFAAAEAHG